MTQHTLHGAPFTCSFAVHLVLTQHDIPLSLRWQQRGSGRLIQGDEYRSINPKRKVPTLVLPDGEVICEMVGVMQYLDDQYGPKRSPTQRRQLVAWLSYLATELHKQVLAPAFDPETPDASREDVRVRLLPPVLAHLEDTLQDRQNLLGGETPSVVDAYLFWALFLLHRLWPDTVSTPGLTAFRRNMMGQPFLGPVMMATREVWAG